MRADSRPPEALEQAARRLAGARSVLALCGAGLSAESGVPTFRGPGGLWRDRRPEDLATPQAFDRDPLLVWDWYRWRLQLVLEARPNAGHLALAELGRRLDLTILNQNVDGLLEAAVAEGNAPNRARVLPLHGSILVSRCERCRSERPTVELPSSGVPRCECGQRFRPGVVWFGESLDGELLRQADRALEQADLVLAIGTSALVWPAASVLPAARALGKPTIEVNPDETAFSGQADLRLAMSAALALPGMLARKPKESA